jgi:exopolysaccharide biosynthesis polyprenyl glycosylphosphotransferase
MKSRLFKRDHRDAVALLCVNLTILNDALWAGLALCLAHLIRFRMIPNTFSRHPRLVLVETMVLGIGLFILITAANRGYTKALLLRFRRSIAVIFKSCCVWLLIFPAISLFLEILPNTSRVFIFLGAPLMCLFVLSGRFILYHLLRLKGATAAFRERILFIDWTERVQTLTREIENDIWHPYEIAGIAPPLGNRFSKLPEGMLPVLGSHAEVGDLLEKRLIHIVILGDGDRREEEIAPLAILCERHNVRFMMIPSGFQILLSGLQISTISRVPVLGIMELPLEKPVNAILKRGTDIVGSLIGLIIFTPAIVLFGLIVCIESPGPMIFRQKRINRGGRQFDMFKIRSMRPDAATSDHLFQSTSEVDPRVLRVGRFMRRWNIDELPQFWNVLKGDMSLVGPRPERPFHAEKLSIEIEHYGARHHIKPGLTGWAAVNGFRGDTDLEERIRYDLYYMENWSLALDFQIMLMTFWRWEGAA